MGRPAAPALGLHAMGTASRFGLDPRHESPRRAPGYWWSAALPSRRAHVVAAVLVSLIILPAGYVAYCMATLPDNGGLVIEPTPSALIVEAADGQVFASRGVFKGDKLSAQDIPVNLSRAIIAIEDRHFYEHRGFYLPSILRAMVRNIRSSSAREGGSTITQQLARMTYLSPERTIRRKLQEAILALWMERKLGKEEILSRYLNTVFRGRCLWRRRRRETLLRQDRQRIIAQRGGDARGPRARAFRACSHPPSRGSAAAGGARAQGDGRDRRDLPRAGGGRVPTARQLAGAAR